MASSDSICEATCEGPSTGSPGGHLVHLQLPVLPGIGPRHHEGGEVLRGVLLAEGDERPQQQELLLVLVGEAHLHVVRRHPVLPAVDLDPLLVGDGGGVGLVAGLEHPAPRGPSDRPAVGLLVELVGVGEVVAGEHRVLTRNSSCGYRKCASKTVPSTSAPSVNSVGKALRHAWTTGSLGSMTYIVTVPS